MADDEGPREVEESNGDLRFGKAEMLALARLASLEDVWDFFWGTRATNMSGLRPLKSVEKPYFWSTEIIKLRCSEKERASQSLLTSAATFRRDLSARILSRPHQDFLHDCARWKMNGEEGALGDVFRRGAFSGGLRAEAGWDASPAAGYQCRRGKRRRRGCRFLFPRH